MIRQRIAFVACNKNKQLFRQDPSYIYRCENLGLALKQLGHQVDFVHLQDLSWRNLYDIIVFHRPKANLLADLKQTVQKKRGTVLVADIDDLIFHSDWAPYSPGVVNQLVPLKTTRRQFQLHYKALQQFKRITVSTSPLQQRIEELWPDTRCLIQPNVAHLSWYPHLPTIPGLNKNTKKTKLGYCPGTRSHDRDFLLIQPVLEQILDEDPELTLTITGPLSCSLKARPGQLLLQPKVPFAQFHQVVAAADINLAPLEQSLFNQHKSALKVVEASFWGIPTLCSALPDLQRMPDSSYRVAESPQQWYNMLKQLIDSPDQPEPCHSTPEPAILSLASHWLNWCLAE